MIYDTKALTITMWVQLQSKLQAEGWEFLKQEHGVVYIRRSSEQARKVHDNAVIP